MVVGPLLSGKHIPDFFLERHNVRTRSAQGQQWPGRPLIGFRGGPKAPESLLNLVDLHGLVRQVGGGSTFFIIGALFFTTAANFFTTGRLHLSQEQLSLRLEQFSLLWEHTSPLLQDFFFLQHPGLKCGGLRNQCFQRSSRGCNWLGHRLQSFADVVSVLLDVEWSIFCSRTSHLFKHRHW